MYIKNWRPTSLLNVAVKIASKAIAKRLETVLPLIIHENQCAYVKGRSSLRSRRKRGRGERTREKNGVLGARDEGTPATKTPIFSSPPTDFQVIQLS